MNSRQNSLEALLIGTASSLLAATVVGISGARPITVALISAAGLVMVSLAAWKLRERFRVLKSIGIVDWEKSMSTGTTTAMCVNQSQTTIRFLGIAATKWLADPGAFRRMLQRHASNGGHAQFLLLHPDSNECHRFESIKHFPPGTLSKQVRKNAHLLMKLKAEQFRIETRFYTTEARFRVAITDEHIMLVGLYSFTTDSGEDTPQLVLDSAKLPWSFYYAMNAYFLSTWESAVPAESVLCAADLHADGAMSS